MFLPFVFGCFLSSSFLCTVIKPFRLTKLHHEVRSIIPLTQNLSQGIHTVHSLGNPQGYQKVAGGRSPRRPPEKSLVMTAPLRRGATQLMSHSGGLRGLRPPATFFATLRVAEVSQTHRYPRKGEGVKNPQRKKLPSRLCVESSTAGALSVSTDGRQPAPAKPAPCRPIHSRAAA